MLPGLPKYNQVSSVDIVWGDGSRSTHTTAFTAATTLLFESESGRKFNKGELQERGQVTCIRLPLDEFKGWLHDAERDRIKDEAGNAKSIEDIAAIDDSILMALSLDGYAAPDA